MGVSARVRAAVVVSLAFAWVAAAANFAHAGDPTLVWHTIETPHFVIHYHEPLGEVAEHVAAAAEHSHTVLVPVFGHEPEEKTQVVLVDNTDGANGFASVIPRNRIQLFASAPFSSSTLNDHDDWLYLLVAHEYSHILHLDSIGGIARWVNKVLGKTWAPNQVQPRWVIEGIATYQESAQSSGGRIRSAIFDMDLRAATLADEAHDLDAMSTLPRNWPHGNTAYLYGSHFLKYIFDRHGADKLRAMSWAYGSMPIPYGINRSIQTATGYTFEELRGDWDQHLRDKYSLQFEAVERAGVRAGRRLTFTAQTNRSPRYSDDGDAILWLQGDGYEPSALRRMPVDGNVGHATEYARIERLGEYDVLADGSMVVEQSGSYQSNYSFQDLYLWDRETQTAERLTRGLRAREPAISPDERWLAFKINAASQSRLAVMPLRPYAPHRILWEGEDRFDQADAPAWSPDGAEIALSVWRRGGERDIVIVDVDSGESTALTRDRAIDLAPVFSPDGRYLYYVSDRSGIYNVYAFDREHQRTYQVTNVVGGAFSPDVSPDGTRMVYEGFGVGGYDLYEITLDPARWTEPVAFANIRPEPVEIRNQPAPVIEARPYRPIETLAPQSYTVELAATPDERLLSLGTGGGDVVGHHGYGLGLTVDLDSGDLDVAGSYSYSRLWPSLRVSAARSLNQRGGVLIDGVNNSYLQEAYRLTGSVSVPALRTDRGGGNIALDYNLDWLRVLDEPFVEPDPNQLLPRRASDARFAGLALRWSYSNARGNIYTIGGQEGQSLSASMRLDHPELGSDALALTLSYRWDAFRTLPWSPTSSLSLRLAGGLRINANGQSGIFALGGAPEQNIVQSIIDSSRTGTSGYLRGYPARVAIGRQYHLLNLEYRQQLFEIERGLSTLPVFVRRVHVAGLLDAGDAFSGEFDVRDFKLGVGASLRLDMVFGYFIPGSLDIGYARGLIHEGIGESWVLLTGSL